MRFVLDFEGRSPLYCQLQDQIRYAITVGDLAPGDFLPSIRELEVELKINRNTIRRAYLQLESEGLLEIRQGREARVAERPSSRSRVDLAEQADFAESLAAATLQRAEAEGLDALLAAEYFATLARQHDTAHPKWAFVECCPRQAADFAGHVELQLGRRVVPVDLHDLRAAAGELPRSIRYCLTPHWHAAETRELIDAEVFGIGMRLSSACLQMLRSLTGRSIGVVVRDAESAPGFGDLVRKHAGSATVHHAFLGDRAALAAMLPLVDSIVFTTPCSDAVVELVNGSIPTHEIVFEPDPQDVSVVFSRLFPAVLPGVSVT